MKITRIFTPVTFPILMHPYFFSPDIKQYNEQKTSYIIWTSQLIHPLLCVVGSSEQARGEKETKQKVVSKCLPKEPGPL